MQTRSDCKLSQLPVETQIKLAELAEEVRLDDLVKILRESHGMDTNRSAVGRFLRKWREERLKSEAAEMSETMEALVAGRDRKKFRKGTLAMLQQRIYEEAIATGDFEQVKECYRELAGEEDRAEGLELQRRRLELAAMNVEIGRRRVELMAAKAPKRVAIDADCGSRNADCGIEGHQNEPAKLLTEGHEGNEELRKRLEKMEEILNRGGEAAEKVLEARRVLAGREDRHEGTESAPR